MKRTAGLLRVGWPMALVGILLAATIGSVAAAGFTRAPVVMVDGVEYAFNIPGHTWVQTGPNGLRGKHYNTGPLFLEEPQWWSSDAPDGELLFVVDAIIDTWSEEKANAYAERGYVHYHEFRTVAGTLHPTKVAWLKHTARTTFTFDGGPHPDPYDVTPGVDYEFLPNGLTRYTP